MSAIPILMYHALPENIAGDIHRVHVSARVFREQIGWLVQNGYVTISVAQAVQIIKEGRSHPKYVVLTFDDGFSSVFNVAYPLLRQYGFTGTLYLVADVVGRSSYVSVPGFEAAPAGDRPMTWDEIRIMVQSGWEIGSHSCSHTMHSMLTRQQLHHEMADSRKVLSSALGIYVRSYAFPFGAYTRTALDALTTAGYDCGLSVHTGLANYGSDLRRMKRIEVNADDTPQSFAAKVTTGYASKAQKWRGRLRDILFSSPAVKDLIQRNGK